MDMILDAYEKALSKRPRLDHRHRVEHLGNWMMTPERVARSKKLGILPIANPPFLFFLGDPMVEMLQRRATEQGFPCDCVGRAAQFNGPLPCRTFSAAYWTALTILTYPVQRHRLPEIAQRISSSVGAALCCKSA